MVGKTWWMKNTDTHTRRQEHVQIADSVITSLLHPHSLDHLIISFTYAITVRMRHFEECEF